jgi:hypothetical protein
MLCKGGQGKNKVKILVTVMLAVLALATFSDMTQIGRIQFVSCYARRAKARSYAKMLVTVTLSVLALCTLGDMAQIGLILFVSYHAR